MSLQLAPATPADVIDIHAMIVEFAAFERLSHLCTGSPAALAEALFGPMPAAEVVLGYCGGALAGFALVLPELFDVSRPAGPVAGGPVCAPGIPRTRARGGAPDPRGGAGDGAWLRAIRMVGAGLEHAGHRVLPGIGRHCPAGVANRARHWRCAAGTRRPQVRRLGAPCVAPARPVRAPGGRQPWRSGQEPGTAARGQIPMRVRILG